MDDLHKYFTEFLSGNNPLIYSVVFSLIIVASIMWIFIKVILPMRIKFVKEKQEMELKQAKLTALFSELDPDPLLRINEAGEIIETNLASREIFGKIKNKKMKIGEILKAVKINPVELIGGEKEISFLENIMGKIYSINIKGSKAFGFANIYLHDITKIKEYEIELEDYKDKLKTLAERLEQKFEMEKKSISSELHDDIGQRLVLLKLKSSQLNNSEGYLFKDLEAIYTRVRELSHLLKPAEIDEFGLRFAIQNLVDKVSSDSRLEGSFSFLGDEERINPEAEICLFRVVQEALSNIIKHAEAKEFSVQLIYNERNIDLIISDDGKGIPNEYFQSKNLKNFGIGIFSMKERIENFDGTMKINSFPEEGTSIIINMPKSISNNGTDSSINS